MIRPSKKWLVYLAVSGLCLVTSSTYTSEAEDIYSDANVSISSAVDRYIAITTEAEAKEQEVVEKSMDITLNLGASLSQIMPVQEEAVEEMTEEPTTTEVATSEYTEYADKAVIIKNSYVNIREAGNTDCSVIGSVAPGEVVTVIEKGAEWSKVKVYGITGFIRNDMLAFGDDAAEFVQNDYERIAVINTGSLRVRSSATTESQCLAYLPAGGSYSVLSEEDGWTYIQVNSTLSGYVRNDYITLTNGKPNNYAAVLEQQQETTTQTTTESTPQPAPEPGSSGITGCTGQDVANFAVQFVGNPYVYGGTSLTNGADCSGFVQSVYKNFGISLNRTAGSQSVHGIQVSAAEAQPGDLVFYDHGTGSIEHVGIYIGNGQIVHASTSKTGIIIADMYYSNVFLVKRIIY